jgi:hypothetical protein
MRRDTLYASLLEFTDMALIFSHGII